MQFIHQGNSLTVLVANPRKIEPERSDISALLILQTEERNSLLNATLGALPPTKSILSSVQWRKCDFLSNVFGGTEGTNFLQRKSRRDI
ncbi:hypothetical protein [Vibrio coralliilyticus]|uniref:hypothetical protein n=1 Tax=Vibrio coralliilyticus TaxID=190893 RepID=UPI000C1678D3|nr:hypothetical protein [Vibrio coralliilyticus]